MLPELKLHLVCPLFCCFWRYCWADTLALAFMIWFSFLFLALPFKLYAGGAGDGINGDDEEKAPVGGHKENSGTIVKVTQQFF